MSASRGPGVVLIGMRGAGKSTVGAELSRRLTWEFSDTDALIVSRVGMSIAEIFADRGEEAFRRIEWEVIASLAPERPQVVAAGGGAVLRSENVPHLQRMGPLVWLSVDAEELARRVRADDATPGSRPSLTGKSAELELIDVLRERTPVYESSCDFKVDGAGSAAEVAARVLEVIGGPSTSPQNSV